MTGMRTPRAAAVTAALLITATLLAGCGSDGKGAPVWTVEPSGGTATPGATAGATPGTAVPTATA
ncbi:MAG: hypothetical protein M3127_03835, partial [Actinomycetota bacterium]|nr:hypothetical protein [Actinomycetota bacterium]